MGNLLSEQPSGREDDDALAVTAHLFQAEIPKTGDARVAVACRKAPRLRHHDDVVVPRVESFLMAGERLPFDADAMIAARRRHRMTQADLAERSGIKLSVISSYESGRRVPRKGNYPKLAAALDISLHALFGITEGEETVRELRLLAAKDQADVAELLFGSVPGASVPAVVTWLGQIERGKEVPYWNDPVVLRNLLLILSDAYRVTQEEVKEA
ncbi:helix-turn-helix domain-containing protein [Streptomyces sp. NPDC002187]|uniref:helix-turn-helix domain-containing protein n=1 Tax=Streptomyces sp. NPDC002187 TaxID=3364637 RepID=UPI0036C74585